MTTMSIRDLPNVLEVARMLHGYDYIDTDRLLNLVKQAEDAAIHFQYHEVWKDDALITAETAKEIRRQIKETRSWFLKKQAR